MAKLRAPKLQKRIEICRSFAFKLNLGNYQSADFFASAKQEVPEDQGEALSEKLYRFCRREILKSIAEFNAENEPLTSEEIRQRKDELQTAPRAPRKQEVA